MTHVPNQFVMRRVEDMVQRDGQLNHAKPRPKVAAGDSTRGDHLLAKLLGELDQLMVLQRAEVRRGSDTVKQRRETFGAHSQLPGAARKRLGWINALSTFIGREPCLQLSRKAGQIVSWSQGSCVTRLAYRSGRSRPSGASPSRG